ncbi:MAG: outer membrane beta-barrel protein [Bacteroidia bacterium]|nr:outer membrane beta-barrel protein [Bacteroidia bacterium]
MNTNRLKRTLVSGLFSVFALFLYAQPGTPPSPEAPEAPEAPSKVETVDTTEVSWGKKKLVIITDSEGKRIEIRENGEDWDIESDGDDYDYDYEQKDDVPSGRSRSEVSLLALDLGITNYYLDGNYGADATIPELELMPFRPGSHVALHLLPSRVSLIGRGVVNLKSAITIDWSNHYFVNDITLIDGQESVTFDTTGVEFRRNKLTTRYAQIPLLLNINTDPGGNDGVSISVGGYAGVLWNAHTRQVSDENGKVRVNGDFNVNPFRYGLTARVDFKWFDFYLNYHLSELFEEGQGPATQLFTAGINLINF